MWAYLSFIQLESPEIVRNLKFNGLSWLNIINSLKDLMFSLIQVIWDESHNITKQLDDGLFLSK